MKVPSIKSVNNIKIDETMKFLQERNCAYIKRQLARPTALRNPIPPKVNIFRDFLVLVGVFPIKHKNIK